MSSEVLGTPYPPVHSLLNPPVRPALARKRRVLIVDDHWFFAACLRTFVDDQADFVVCDVAPCSADLRERIRRLEPDLLVIDLALGGERGLSLGERLRGQGVRTPILFVSTLARPSRAELDAVGSCAFGAKSKKPLEFLRILRRTLDACDGDVLQESDAGLTQIKSLA
jgi:DNA-binding NarL/FixJ family response regulator